MSIAEQMGSVLENTSHSVNIKERLDFSCALFDTQGQLIANAPHMPVHLGSMGDSVQTIIRERRWPRARRCFHAECPLQRRHAPARHHRGHACVPAVGAATALLGGVAWPSRRHRRDPPGSMPPMSRSIEEEGVLFDDFQLLERGTLRAEALLARLRRRTLSSAQSRAEPRRSDRADRCATSAEPRSCGWPAQFGTEAHECLHGHVQDYAEEQVRRSIEALSDGEFASATRQWRRHPRRDRRSIAGARRAHRLHRHPRAS